MGADSCVWHFDCESLHFIPFLLFSSLEEFKSLGWYLKKNAWLTSLISFKNFKQRVGGSRKLASRAISSNVAPAHLLSRQSFQKTHVWSAPRSEASTLWWAFERRSGRSMMNRVAARRSKRLRLTTRVPSSSLHFPWLSQAKGKMRPFQDRYSSPLSISPFCSPFLLASHSSLHVSSPLMSACPWPFYSNHFVIIKSYLWQD